MNETTAGILNSTLTRDYVCGVDGCDRRLRERCVGGEWIVDCAGGHTGPFITGRAADRAKSRKLERLGVAVTPGTKLTAAEVRGKIDALFGDEDTGPTRPGQANPTYPATPERNAMTIAELPDKTITQAATADLLALPDQLRSAETTVANLTIDLRQAKSEAASAELDAQINAAPDGKNAEARKLQLEAAVNASPAVAAARDRVALLEAELATAEVEQTALARKYRAALALAELQAAKITFMATFKPVNGRN